MTTVFQINDLKRANYTEKRVMSLGGPFQMVLRDRIDDGPVDSRVGCSR